MKTEKKSKLDVYLSKIKGLFNDEAEQEQEQEQEKFGSVTATNAEGAEVVINYPGETLEVGAAITHTVEDEEKPVPTGEYTLADGQVLIVSEEGIVGELRATEENPEDEMEKDDGGLKAEQIDALIDGIAEIIANFKKEVAADIKTSVEASAAALREEFNKPGDDHEEETPEDKDKKNIVQGLSRFVSEANKK